MARSSSAPLVHAASTSTSGERFRADSRNSRIMYESSARTTLVTGLAQSGALGPARAEGPASPGRPLWLRAVAVPLVTRRCLQVTSSHRLAPTDNKEVPPITERPIPRQYTGTEAFLY